MAGNRFMNGTGQGRKAILLICMAALLCGSFTGSTGFFHAASGVVIRLDPDVTFQTITGWEAVAFAGDGPEFKKYKGPLLNKVVRDLGINRIRLEIKSGVENPVDFFVPGSSSERDAYEIVNDNNDPFVINPSGFQFSSLDYSVTRIITGLKRRLENRGEKLYVNVNYVDFGSSAFEHKNASEEYAEFVLATYQHLDTKFGIVPDAWEVILEPENAGWSADQMRDAIVAAGRRLLANGYTPRFIAPSNASMSIAVSYFDSLIQDPEVESYLSELSYHRYEGVSAEALKAIGSRAKWSHVRTAMLERIGATYVDLHDDLKIGRNSSWGQYTLANTNVKDDNGAKYFLVDISNPAKPVIVPGSRTKFLRQYFKFVRSGAVRIKARSNDRHFDPLAFINRNGKYVLVVKADSAGSFEIRNLPAGRYGIKYTTFSEYDIDLPNIILDAGQSLNAMIPAAGVITVYTKKLS